MRYASLAFRILSLVDLISRDLFLWGRRERTVGVLEFLSCEFYLATEWEWRTWSHGILNFFHIITSLTAPPPPIIYVGQVNENKILKVKPWQSVPLPIYLINNLIISKGQQRLSYSPGGYSLESLVRVCPPPRISDQKMSFSTTVF